MHIHLRKAIQLLKNMSLALCTGTCSSSQANRVGVMAWWELQASKVGWSANLPWEAGKGTEGGQVELKAWIVKSQAGLKH